MTKTLWTTRRTLQRSQPGGTPTGVTTSALARFSAVGEVFSTLTGTTEADRDKIYDAGAFSPAADFLGRLVTIRNTPDDSGISTTTKKLENNTYRVKFVDPSFNFIRLEGVRFEDEGLAVAYTIHASCTFSVSAGDAIFPIDEGPLGPGGPPGPAERTNTGPTIMKGLFFPSPVDQALRATPFTVTDRISSISLRISDTFDRLVNVPLEGSLEWILKDRPAYTYQDWYKQCHRFIISCGWSVLQSRGRNDGVGAGRRIVHDTIYFSNGEDEDQALYARFVCLHRSNNADGTDTQNVVGFDFAMFSIWDPAHADSVGINRGNGVNACGHSMSTNVNNTNAEQADGLNTTNSHETFFSPDNNDGSFVNAAIRWSNEDAVVTPTQDGPRFRPNNLNTPAGGEIMEIGYTFYGDKNGIVIFSEAAQVGTGMLHFGKLDLLPSGNPNNFTLTSRVQAGGSVTLRTGDTVDPESPPSGPAYIAGDFVQLVGQTVNAGVVATTSHNGEYVETVAIASFPGRLSSTGQIVCVAGASLADGELTVINDGEGNTETFEHDDNASVGGGNIPIDISTGTPDADDIRDLYIAAIIGSTLNITPSIDGSGLVLLTHNTLGDVGDVPMTTNAGGGFAVFGMNGGGFSFQVLNLLEDYEPGALVGEDPQPIFIANPHRTDPFSSVVGTSKPGTGVTSNQSIRFGNRSNHNDATYHDHNGPSMAVNGNGFGGILKPAGLENARQIDPSERTGRFSIVPILALDPSGGQVRGTLPHWRLASVRMREFRFVEDRDGFFFWILPDVGLTKSSSVVAGEAHPWQAVLGPMPKAMAVV